MTEDQEAKVDQDFADGITLYISSKQGRRRLVRKSHDLNTGNLENNVNPKRTTRVLIGGLMSIFSFVACLLFTVGPDLIRYHALMIGIFLGIVSWPLMRDFGGKIASVGGSEVTATLNEEKEWLIASLGEKVGTNDIEIEIDPSTYLPDASMKRIIHLRVVVNGHPLENALVFPIFSGILDTDSKETRRYMLKEQIARLRSLK